MTKSKEEGKLRGKEGKKQRNEKMRLDPPLSQNVGPPTAKDKTTVVGVEERGVRPFFFFLLLLSGGKVKYFQSKWKKGWIARMQG